MTIRIYPPKVRFVGGSEIIRRPARNATRPKRVNALPRARPEREIQAAILALLRTRGVPAWKVGSGAFHVDGRYVPMGRRGMSDIVGVLPVCPRCALALVHHQHAPWGRFVGIEVKSERGTPTMEQSAFLHAVRSAGGLGFVARSCEDVVRELGW